MRIYEIVNLARRESVLAVTPEGPEAFSRRLGPPRPAAIAHWPESEEVFTDCIAEGLEAVDAEEFMRLFLRSTILSGWKTALWRP